MHTLRICRYCDTEKDFSEFTKSRSGRFGITWCCKMCQRTKNGYPAIPQLRTSKWISIRRINVNGYKGAAIYRLWFDSHTLFYIGSCVSVKSKVNRWVKNFRIGKINRRMKELIQDKTKCEFEIVERIDDTSILFNREEFFLAQYKNNPAFLNRSLSAIGDMAIPVFDGDFVETSKSKPVNKYKNGISVMAYNSISLAAKDNKIDSSVVWNFCYGNRKSAMNGFTYSFSNQSDIDEVVEYKRQHTKEKIPKIHERETSNIIELYKHIGVESIAKQYKVGIATIKALLKKSGVELNKGTPARKILQLTKTGNVINEYPSIGIAGKILKINRKRISEILHGRESSVHGFVFKFSTNDENDKTNRYLQTSLPL